MEEGVKDRPCAIVLSVLGAGREYRVTVLPITRTPPTAPGAAIEIPAPTKLRLGLDSERSWIVVTESNEFDWPGPDLRPVESGDPGRSFYGYLPRALFRQVVERFVEFSRTSPSRKVRRTE